MPLSPDDPRINLHSTAFIIYNHPDLSSARSFLLDFGLTIAHETPGHEIFFKGYGTEPFIYIARSSPTVSFGGAAYTVTSSSELSRAATTIPNASPITPLNAPGGGCFVKLTDPAGHIVYLVHGQTPTDPHPPVFTDAPTNYEFDTLKPRKGAFQRFTPGPTPVHRWGHYGVTYPPGTYQAMYDWYTKYLSLAPSDVVYKGDEPVTCFFHIDRGLEFTDHHAFFFKEKKEGEERGVAHSAFETHGFDVQMLGHDWLGRRGWRGCWGVGRHVLGSQVFDYWFDASGFIVEHYSDGDLVNSETEVSHVQAGPQALKIWGPPVPAVF